MSPENASWSLALWVIFLLVLSTNNHSISTGGKKYTRMQYICLYIERERHLIIIGEFHLLSCVLLLVCLFFNKINLTTAIRLFPTGQWWSPKLQANFLRPISTFLFSNCPCLLTLQFFTSQVLFNTIQSVFCFHYSDKTGLVKITHDTVL